jgi:hypothetical protein
MRWDRVGWGGVGWDGRGWGGMGWDGSPEKEPRVLWANLLISRIRMLRPMQAVELLKATYLESLTAFSEICFSVTDEHYALPLQKCAFY